MAVTFLLGNTLAGVTHWTGTGAPEGFVTAQIGEFYTDHGAGTMYMKVTGEETNTGWVKMQIGAQTAQVPWQILVTGALTAAANKVRLQAPVAGTIVGVRLSATTAPVGAAILVDINKAGTTLFTTQGNRPTIADGASDSVVAVPDVTAIAAGDVITVDVDQVGAVTPGTNMLVTIALRVSTE